MIDYSPLWKTMEEKGITQYKMIELGIDRRVLDSLRKNRNITLLTVEKLCKVLDCEPNDIVEFHEYTLPYSRMVVFLFPVFPLPIP